MQTLTTLIIYFYCFMSASTTEEGRPCNSTAGWSGTCKLSYDCLPLADLVEQGHSPELCENVGGPIICCPEQTIETTRSKSQQPEAQPLKQSSPLLLGMRHKKPNVALDTIQEPSEYPNPTRKMTTYTKRIIRRRPCLKRYSSHILLQSEDDVDYVKIRTHLSKPIRAKRKPLPIRETIVLPERKVIYANHGGSPFFESIRGSTGSFSYGSHLYQPALHTVPFTYQSHYPFHISSPTAVAESAIYGKYSGNQDTAPPLFDDLSEAQSTARPNRSAQKSRPAEIMCDIYSEIVTETVAELSKNGLHPIKTEKCSLVVPTPSQGRTVTSGQLPHVVGLGYKDNAKKIHWDECSGTLISDDYVVTAAHCIHSPLGQPIVASLGMTTLGYQSSETEIAISEIVTHPQYNSTTYYNDIALLKLAERPKFNDKLRPACLHIDNHIPKGLLVAHWATLPPVVLEVLIGKNESHKFADKDGLGLQKTRMTLADNKECDIAPDMDDAFVCAHLVSSRSTLNCQGNGGDPLQIRSPSNKCLYNIVGLSVENVCDESVPVAFTKVSPYVSWIESVVWP